MDIDIMIDFGSGLTTVRADVRTDIPVRLRYGLPGASIADRCATTGTLTFALDNSEANSATTKGYYSPGHGSCRTGFRVGLRVALVIPVGLFNYYKFTGTIESLRPTAGQYGEQITYVTCVDWMDEAARHKLALLALQTSKRGDQLITTVLANMTKQPDNTTLATGLDTFPYAGDTWQDERTTALAALQSIAQSEFGYVYIKGGYDGTYAATGTTLTFENRHTRLRKTSTDFAVDESALDVVVRRTRGDVFNRVEVTVHPREVDAGSPVTLFTLKTKPVVRAGETVYIDGRYTDPNQRGVTRVGGANMIAPVATTDYTMNTAEDGSGTNLTASFTVTATFGANTVRFAVANGAAQDGYITSLKCRGDGLYDFEPVTVSAEDSTSQTTYGERTMGIDMPLQTSANVARDAAEYALAGWKDETTRIEKIVFIADNTRAIDFLTAAAEIEPGARVAVIETQTAVAAPFFVQSVEMEIAQRVTTVAWAVIPASEIYEFWVLDTSQLNSTTILVY